MEILEYFYENKPEILKFYNRKTELENGRTILYGAIGSGKSYIMINKLLEFKNDEILYINFADFRVNVSEILKDLDKFLQKNLQISVLGFDNLNEILNDEIEILDKILNTHKIENIFITTRLKNLNFKNFTQLEIFPLSFEEFILFDRRNDVNAAFSTFLQRGNSAKNAFLQNFQIIQNEQIGIKSSFRQNEIEILKAISKYNGEILSINKIYTELKEKFKISKDSVYGAIYRFENENIINFIPKFNDFKAAKKIYFSNFNFGEIFSLKKDFHKKFANAIYCELRATQLGEIFYNKDFDFLIPKRNMAFLIIPFSASDIVFLRFKKLINTCKSLKIIRVNVISMANSGTMEIEGIKCEVVPFYEFALGL